MLLAHAAFAAGASASGPEPAAAEAAAARQSCAGGSAKRESVVEQLEANVGCFINRERARRRLRPFRLDARLAKAADGHASDMVRRCYFAHTTPSGVTIGERVRRAGYTSGASRWTAGEAIAWLSPREHPARTVVRMWLDSPPHRHLLLSPEFREVGLGISRGVPACPGKGLTFVADLGRRW